MHDSNNNREIEFIDHNYSSEDSSLWVWPPWRSPVGGEEGGWRGAHGWSNQTPAPGVEDAEPVFQIPGGLPEPRKKAAEGKKDQTLAVILSCSANKVVWKKDENLFFLNLVK